MCVYYIYCVYKYTHVHEHVYIYIYNVNIYYIAKSIGTPSNERFDYFSNFHEYKS